MSDVIFVAVMIAFFVLCALYVQLCDRMIGTDELAMAGNDADSTLDDVSASSTTSSVGNSGGVTQ